MKTKKEVNALKEEALEQVTGGNTGIFYNNPPCVLEYVTQKPPFQSCEVASDHPDCVNCPSNPNFNYSPSYEPGT